MRCPSCHCCNLRAEVRENNYDNEILYCKVEDMYLTGSMYGLKVKSLDEETAFPMDIHIQKVLTEAVNKKWNLSKVIQEIKDDDVWGSYKKWRTNKDAKRIIRKQHRNYLAWYKTLKLDEESK